MTSPEKLATPETAKSRAFIDKNGGYQTTREGIDKEAHDAWVPTTSWGLSRDDFIRLSYFHGDLESGSDGSGPVNGSEDRPGDTVYIAPSGHGLTRAMVSEWLRDYGAFIHGYKVCARLATQRQGEGETRDAALEQAANLVECEYAADATQGRRLAQIAQHIRDLKKRGV